MYLIYVYTIQYTYNNNSFTISLYLNKIFLICLDLSYESSQKVRLLNEGVLTKNLGLDVVVVITMTDCIKNLEIDNYSEEHFDYIQCCLRKFCLQFGAALFYVSVMEDKNCDLLYKYLMHR